MPLPQGVTAFYYRAPDGKVTRLGAIGPRPTASSSRPTRRRSTSSRRCRPRCSPIRSKAPGKIGQQRVFCTLKQAAGKTNGGGDGLTVDTKGNLYITSALGLQVFDPQGKLLGIIEFPEQPANLHFRRQRQQDALRHRPHVALFGADGSRRPRFPAGKR